jgi:hypothetical protein
MEAWVPSWECPQKKKAFVVESGSGAGFKTNMPTTTQNNNINLYTLKTSILYQSQLPD